jgi:hypothetical protein
MSARGHAVGPPAGDWSRHNVPGIGLRALSGQRPGWRQRRAGWVVLATDVDQAASVAAVLLVRRPGSSGSARHTLQFEHGDGWRWLGGDSGSARDLALSGRPTAAVHGPASMMRFLGSSAARSRADRERLAAGPGGGPGAGPGAADAGWVASAGFRLATEVARLEVAGRAIPVPAHGYAVVAWRSPPALTRPVIAAIGPDGSRLCELGPHGSLDSLTWESVQRAVLRDGLGDGSPGPELP